MRGMIYTSDFSLRHKAVMPLTCVLLTSNYYLEIQDQNLNQNLDKDPDQDLYWDLQERRAKILAMRDFCLNEDVPLCGKANLETSIPELIVLRD